MDKDKALDAAIADGRLVPEARERWSKMWDKDPKATAAVLKELAPGLRPEQQAVLDEAVGRSSPGLPDDWFRTRHANSRAVGGEVAGASSRPPASSASPAAKGKEVEAEAIDWPEFANVKSPRRGRVTKDQGYGRGD